MQANYSSRHRLKTGGDPQHFKPGAKIYERCGCCSVLIKVISNPNPTCPSASQVIQNAIYSKREFDYKPVE
jgi:hypothetical protein